MDDAPSGSVTVPSLDPPPLEGQAHAMEAQDECGCSHPASPISHEDDNLLMGGEAIGVESDLAHLTVLSLRGQGGEGEEASK